MPKGRKKIFDCMLTNNADQSVHEQKKIMDRMENHGTKLRECKALRAGLESCPPTLNEGEGAETVRHRILEIRFRKTVQFLPYI